MELDLLTQRILEGYEITKQEALKLYKYDCNKLLNHSQLITRKFKKNKFSLCSIINGKSGSCSEDCKYCAQSSHYNCKVEKYSMLDEDTIMKTALKNEKDGIKRFSIVTSGKKVTNKEIGELCNIYSSIHKKLNIQLCASHGLLRYDDFIKFKKAGVTRYHNNLETSRRYFQEICSTHTYDEKINTIKDAKKAGLEVCSGGIMGMGESIEDNIDLAIELRNLTIKSIPLNLLNPIEGTPLAEIKQMSEEEFYKICTIFRFVNPSATIRLAGGRGLLNDKGKRIFEYCINGMITGDLLTTVGNSTLDDVRMVNKLGYKINN